MQTAREVKDKIEKEFGVEYSIRSVERIMKKLNYSYTKPYKIYAKIGEIVPSLTSEHNELWKVIIPDNAVNILSEGF